MPVASAKALPAALFLLVLVGAFIALNPSGQVRSTTHPVSVDAPPVATPALHRMSQVDPAQYASPEEYRTWWPSTCSAASMTEVINSYGHTYRIADILHVEAALGEVTPEQGLLRNTGIDHTVAHFGFSARWLKAPSLDDVISTANNGTPVMVNFPPSRWPGGHFLVVTGGDASTVRLADSSRLNMQTMARPTFARYWGGSAVLVTPAGGAT